MPGSVRNVLPLLGLCALSALAQAQTIYRCGSQYSQVPCEGAIKVNANDARSAEQKTASDEAIARDGRSANALEKARLQAEKQRTAQDAQLRQTQAKASKDAEKTRPKDEKAGTKSRKTESKSLAEPFVAKASAPHSK